VGQGAKQMNPFAFLYSIVVVFAMLEIPETNIL
jgi:hypothetical protein